MSQRQSRGFGTAHLLMHSQFAFLLLCISYTAEVCSESETEMRKCAKSYPGSAEQDMDFQSPVFSMSFKFDRCVSLAVVTLMSI